MLGLVDNPSEHIYITHLYCTNATLTIGSLAGIEPVFMVIDLKLYIYHRQPNVMVACLRAGKALYKLYCFLA